MKKNITAKCANYLERFHRCKLSDIINLQKMFNSDKRKTLLSLVDIILVIVISKLYGRWQERS